MPKTKVEVYDKNQLIYPFIESDHVTFSNGMKVTEMLDQSISMPTVIHEDLSFKVGVGNQDVSSAIVDSSVAEMTIKGKTYQNILPEPSTHVLTNNKEMFKVNEGLDPNVEIVDGVSKSAILSGQTLVNLIEGGDVKKEITYSGGTKARYYFNKSMLKANVDYLLIYEVTDFSGDDSHISFNENNGYGITRSDFNKNGIHKTKVNFSDVGAIKDFIIFYKITGLSLGGFINNVILVEYQDGMENWDIPYFEGMQSVKIPVLTTTGKNLFDGTVVGNYYIGVNGGLVSISDCYATDYIEIESDTNYCINTPENEITGFYDKDKNFISSVQTKSFLSPSNAKFLRTTIKPLSLLDTFQLEEGTTTTPYEPYKSNILTTPEEVVLRGFDSVKDTLNLNTGEYVKRIGELTLDGSEYWQYADNTDGTIRFNLPISDFKNYDTSSNGKNLINNKLPKANFSIAGNTYGVTTWCNHVVFFTEHTNVNDFKQWLSQNPTTIQYELQTPVVKTVDLSSSGNWEKVVLDGSENWVLHNNSGDYVEFRCGNMINNIHDSHLGFSDKFPVSTGGRYERIAIVNGSTYITVESTKAKTVEQLQLWLSQNPITVWYQITATLDSTQVKQPIFFKDGHIQLSSGADNSLIPALDYQAKTSNSYVMDLMKTNTRYTMKAKSASGTFTIDGTSYGAGTNGTFTTPSSMTNKLLVMSNKSNEEVMILEGDVVSKAIQYFKGIKSAFEDESKIEVLSTNHNLWTGVDNYTNSGATIILKDKNECVFEHHAVNNGIKVKVSDYEYQVITMSYDFEILDGKALNVGGHNRHQTKAYYIDGINVGTSYHNGHVTTYEKNRVYHVDHVVHINLPIAGGANGDREYIGIEPNRYSADTPTYCKMRVTNFQIALGNVIKEYEPPKSNSTKIPLLSPLRSLPNGLCDELIIDRMKKKATLIQRVGYTELNGDNSEQWGVDIQKNSRSGFVTRKQYNQKVAGGQNAIVAEHLLAIDDNGRKYDLDYTITMGNIPTYPFVITIPSHIINERGDSFTTIDNAVSKFKCWLSKASISVIYQLETPVITEVDLEGFPYIYKDGHIFLNGEIAPTTEITYSINQCQQISASNEDIIRHEKELTYLQKLIAQYVQVDYESVLLSLKV